jgi:hypothetical protein
MGTVLGGRLSAPLGQDGRTNEERGRLDAVHLKLSDDELRALDQAAPRGPTAGDRYADMSAVAARHVLAAGRPSCHRPFRVADL